MPSHHSVSAWIEGLKAGDDDAAEELWQRYFGQLVALARRRLQGARVRAADGEDAALSAFDSFCRGAEQGRFPRLNDRDDLWQLLVMITERKAIDLLQHERRQKRGGGRTFEEPAAGAGAEVPLDRVADARPTPDFAAQAAEELRRLLGLLDEEELRSVALWKLEGYCNEEIAAKLGCVPRTVERKLQRIRTIWGHAGDAP